MNKFPIISNKQNIYFFTMDIVQFSRVYLHKYRDCLCMIAKSVWRVFKCLFFIIIFNLYFQFLILNHFHRVANIYRTQNSLTSKFFLGQNVIFFPNYQEKLQGRRKKYNLAHCFLIIFHFVKEALKLCKR